MIYDVIKEAFAKGFLLFELEKNDSQTLRKFSFKINRHLTHHLLRASQKLTLVCLK
jgi:hypothetical protein